MNIDIATVERVAALAKLSFNAEEKIKIQADLSKIVTFFEKLNEVDTDGVEPLIFMTDEINVFRDDEPVTDISREEALKNAPQKNSDYFKVPKFLDREQAEPA
jgi:aspartyl-tRNA(Asn)/glutamyl-tRNA(Gln) amidotransferase subunit C